MGVTHPNVAPFYSMITPIPMCYPPHSPAHLKCVRHFCWHNGVDQSVGERMVVGDQEFQNYKQTVSKLLDELMLKKEVARRQVRGQVHCIEGLLP